MNFHKSYTRPIIQSPLKFSNDLPRRQKVVVNRLNFVSIVSTFFFFFFSFFFFGIVRISNFSWNYNLAANDEENRRINRKSGARWQTSILVWTKELLRRKRKKYFGSLHFFFILRHFKYYVFLSWWKKD